MTDWLQPVLAYLIKGFGTTLWVSFLSTCFATAIGVCVGAFSASTRLGIRVAVRLYIDFFRGIPSLIILLFVFFALPQIGVTTGPITACVLGLGLWGAANIAETVRGVLNSVSIHQTIAARALGMAKHDALIFVVMPQALRRFIPPYIGQLTVLVQASALTSVVGVTDVLGAARQMIERLAYSGGSSHSVAIYCIVLGAFFLICYPMTLLAGLLEKKLRR